MLTQRLTGRGRRKLASSHDTMTQGLSAEPLPSLLPAYGEAPVVAPASVTTADAGREGAAVESARAILERPKARVVRTIARSLRWHRIGTRATARAEVHEAKAVQADDEIEVHHQWLDDAGEERQHVAPITRFRVALLCIFGLADAAALFYVTQKLLNLSEGGVDLVVNIGLSLLGFALVVPAVWAAHACRRMFASFSASDVVTVGWKHWAAMTAVASALVLLALYTVGHLRWLGGESEDITEIFMVLFTGLATFGAFSTEFLADNPSRHKLDLLEAARRKSTRLGRWCRVQAHVALGIRDAKLGRSRAIMTKAAERVELAFAASATDINVARASAPVVFGTSPLHEVRGPAAIKVLADLHTFVDDTMLRLGLDELVRPVVPGGSLAAAPVDEPGERQLDDVLDLRAPASDARAMGDLRAVDGSSFS